LRTSAEKSPPIEATYEDALRVAEKLSKTDQRRLAQRLLIETREAAPKERVSIMELEGLGKEIWAGIDTDAYIKAESDSWDR
jgi:hypothetical protein